jgi:hypothetical protein
MLSAGDAHIEKPILQLGAAGFSVDDRNRIALALARLPQDWTPWRLGPFDEADAWWVDGSRTEVLSDGNLQVGAGQPAENTISLHLTSVNRPIAFSAPLATTQFEPRCVFQLDDEAGMHSALHMFGTWLQPLHAEYVVAAMVMRRGAALRHTVHHLNHRGVLLAMLDYREGQIGILPTATPADLWQAEWNPRPAAAHEMPRSFIKYTPAELLWTYVRRTPRDLLPARYRTDKIYYRHVPHVPARWLRDSQRIVLRELNAQPGNFEVLLRRTELPEATLAMDLSCLYFAGAITTTASKAAPPASSMPGQGGHSQPSTGFEVLPAPPRDAN